MKRILFLKQFLVNLLALLCTVNMYEEWLDSPAQLITVGQWLVSGTLNYINSK